jgi:hypothetical protein
VSLCLPFALPLSTAVAAKPQMPTTTPTTKKEEEKEKTERETDIIHCDALHHRNDIYGQFYKNRFIALPGRINT